MGPSPVNSGTTDTCVPHDEAFGYGRRINFIHRYKTNDTDEVIILDLRAWELIDPGFFLDFHRPSFPLSRLYFKPVIKSEFGLHP